MAGTDAVPLPFLMDKPIAGRIAEFWGDNPERFGRDEPCFAKKPGAFGL